MVDKKRNEDFDNTEDLDEIPDLSGEWFDKARPAVEVAPHLVEISKRYRGQRGKQKAMVKERITIRLDPDLVALYRLQGKGWQTLLNDDLRKINHLEPTN
jgi:uncharacterized protein (DUF4415 family)|tara:strand:+ start:270 stop:569 length:300 start_codon:yes stop_codon:yes gene_type:complete